GFFPGLLGDATRKPRLQRCRRTQHIGRPGNEPVDHRAQALQLAPAIRAEAICASAAATSLAGESCRAYAQVVSLCPQRSDCLIPGECELCIPPTTSNASFWIGPGRRAAAKKAPLRYARPHTPAGAAHKRPRYGRVRRPRRFNEGYLRCW